MNFQNGESQTKGWDYLIVDCEDARSLVSHTNDIIDDTFAYANSDDEDGEDQHALMFFVGYDFVTRRHTHTPVQPDIDRVYDAAMKLVKEGKLSEVEGVCFKNLLIDEGFVEIAEAYAPGHFGKKPRQVATFETENGKTVLYKKFGLEKH